MPSSWPRMALSILPKGEGADGKAAVGGGDLQPLRLEFGEESDQQAMMRERNSISARAGLAGHGHGREPFRPPALQRTRATSPSLSAAYHCGFAACKARGERLSSVARLMPPRHAAGLVGREGSAYSLKRGAATGRGLPDRRLESAIQLA